MQRRMPQLLSTRPIAQLMPMLLMLMPMLLMLMKAPWMGPGWRGQGQCPRHW